jgi:MOSC domain-containing protein YiiM
MATLVSIVVKPADLPPRPAGRYQRVPVGEATLVAGAGLDGDRKAAGGDRQVNLMAAEDLERLADDGFRTGPGEMGEQLVVRGVAVAALRPGDRLLVGASACLEAVKPRTGCQRLAEVQAKPVAAASGRLGVMMRVVAGGVIRVGDEVTLTDRASGT